MMRPASEQWDRLWPFALLAAGVLAFSTYVGRHWDEWQGVGTARREIVAGVSQMASVILVEQRQRERQIAWCEAYFSGQRDGMRNARNVTLREAFAGTDGRTFQAWRRAYNELVDETVEAEKACVERAKARVEQE